MTSSFRRQPPDDYKYVSGPARYAILLVSTLAFFTCFFPSLILLDLFDGLTPFAGLALIGFLAFGSYQISKRLKRFLYRIARAEQNQETNDKGET